jgi:hypothetical protein
MGTSDRRLLCVAFLLFFAVCMAARWHTSDSTTYAPGYSETKFRSIRVGMPREEVTRILGNPLSVDPAPGYVIWIYAPNDYRNPRQQANGPVSIPPETTFEADQTGKIISVTGGYLDVNEHEFLGKQLVEVRKRFGNPFEIYSAPNRDYYWYSKMDGVKGHFVRNIVISTQGFVCDINAGCIGYYTGAEDERNLSWIEWLEIHFF